jgi:peptidoglycan/xylan/chitin deacetylase (PgdA/CDA1 family)
MSNLFKESSDSPFSDWYDRNGLIDSCSVPGSFALTYDDGPGPYTPQLLDLLRRKNVTATFFVVGEQVDWNRDTLKRILNEGHLIASHTWNHSDLAFLSNAEIRSQMLSTDALIKEVTGVAPLFMRPPYGSFNESTKKYLLSMGYRIVMWNLDTLDWKYHDNNPNVIYETIKKAITGDSKFVQSNGWITLQHDIHKGTIEQQERIIDLIKGLGYKFVTANECMGNSLRDPYRKTGDGWLTVKSFD